jgi:hypothetical protein
LGVTPGPIFHQLQAEGLARSGTFAVALNWPTSGRLSLPSHGPPRSDNCPDRGCFGLRRPVAGRSRGRGGWRCEGGQRRKMTRLQPPWRGMRLVVAGIMFAGLLGSAERTPAQSAPESCSVASDLARLDLPLSRVAQRLADGESVKIIAIGSSSTAGAGASSRAFLLPEPARGRAQDPFPPGFDHGDQLRSGW